MALSGRFGEGRALPLCPLFSDVDLFGNSQGVVHLDAQVPDGAFDLSVSEQKLNGPKIARATIDQRRLCASQRITAPNRDVR